MRLQFFGDFVFSEIALVIDSLRFALKLSGRIVHIAFRDRLPADGKKYLARTGNCARMLCAEGGIRGTLL